ncbi:hypothetical protein ACOSQ4_003044 [Xanthoceras sorbifolium]
MFTAPNQTTETSNSRSSSNSPITNMALNGKNKLGFFYGSMFGNDATIWCCHGCSMELRRALQVV